MNERGKMELEKDSLSLKCVREFLYFAMSADDSEMFGMEELEFLLRGVLISVRYSQPLSEFRDYINGSLLQGIMLFSEETSFSFSSRLKKGQSRNAQSQD